MSFDLTYRVELSPESKKIYERFVSENKERKEVDYHDAVELLARACVAFSLCRLANGKPLEREQQKQLLKILYESLVKDDLNDFQEDSQISKIIDAVMKLYYGEFEIDLGRKGGGCLPCFSSVKIKTQK